MLAPDRNTPTRRYVRSRVTFADFPTDCHAFREDLRRIQRFAPYDLPLLILGEMGTGKNLVANAIHNASPRHAARFYAVNSACFRGETFHSEVLGHVAGAFTGATCNRKGLLRSCNGGSLLIDEIGKTTLQIQAHLLDVMESGSSRALGADKAFLIDTRLLFSTNLTRDDLADPNRFYQDFVSRLGEAIFVLMPLRERRGDIPIYVRRMLADIAEKNGLATVPTLTKEALDALVARPWRGNLRELRSALAYAVVLAGGGEVALEHLPPLRPVWRERRRDVRPLDEVEQEAALDALAVCGGNKARACEALRIDYRTLMRLLADGEERHSLEVRETSGGA